MGEQFERGNVVRDENELGFPEGLAADLVRTPVEDITKLSAKFKSATDNMVASAVAESKLVRYGVVTVEGLAYTVPGVLNGVYHNLTNLPETGFKIGTAATIGVGMRLLLPEKGAARALVGTIMGAFFVRDALHPLMQAYSDVSDAKDLNAVHASAKKMGDGLGLFVVDSAIGIKVGKMAEGATGTFLKSNTGSRFLQKTMGYENNTAFEAAKETFWNSDKYLHGRMLGSFARGADKMCGALAEKLITRQNRQQLSLEDALKAVDAAGKRAKHSIDDGGFYKYGPRVSQNGERIGFSEYVDRLMAGEKPAEPTARTAGTVDLAPRFSPDEARIPRRIAGGDPSELAPGGKPLEIKAPADPVPPATPPVLKPVDAATAQEFDAANLAKLAGQAKRQQGAWTDEAVQIAELKDLFENPQRSISDKTRKGALLGPEYDASAQQLIGLSQRIQTVDHVKEAGFVLDLHSKAAMQHEGGVPAVVDLNTFAEELHGVFLGGLRKAGVSDNVLSGKVPSRVTIANDQGSGNFTIPNIDGVIERPVTLFPRNQSGLLSVFAGINRHEQIGHDHVYGDLARFPKEFRDVLVGNAVKSAMESGKIADVDIDVPGLGLIKKSEFFKKLLIAEANENTADIVGTATGGADTALTLGILLQSLRKGGLLETRNVLGKQFDEFIEPHGIDRWRVKLAAEVMRQLGNGDKTVDNMANALDNYAARASRAGDNYVWASTDQPGKAVTIPQNEWDAVIPHIVKAQLDTPLDALEGKTFRAILPELAPLVRKIDTLAGHMADSVGKGSDSLVVPFDKNDYTIGQVFSAGLQGWMKAVSRGQDPATSLAHISGISEGLRAQYRQGNPHQVQLVPGPFRAVRTQPLRVASDLTGRAFQQQKALREGSARYATHMGSAATYLLMEDILHHYREKQALSAAGH